MSKKLIYAISFVFLLGSAQAAQLTDAELYFDPASIVPDYYPRFELADLTVENTLIWQGDPNAIIDVDILPILKPGDYPEGFPFSQADYYHKPNIDYYADLTDGDLTVTFNTPGLYHVRIIDDNDLEDIYAVFAEARLKEKKDKADKSGASKKLEPLPDADIFLVEESDSVMDDSAEIWEKAGKEVQRVTSRQDVVDKIKVKSQALGRKIHVEIDGHGTSANISTGAGKDNIADKQIDLTSVEQFQKDIDDYVKHITFQGCSVGRGKDGKKFLKILADSIGKAAAWDQPITVIDQDYFTVNIQAKWVEVEKDSCVLVPVDADAMISAEDSCGYYWGEGENCADWNFGGSEDMWTFFLESVVYLRFRLPDEDLSSVSGAKLHLYGWTGGFAAIQYDMWGSFYHYPEITVYGLKDGTTSYMDENGYERYGEDWLEGTGNWEIVPGITFNNAPANTGYEACSDGSPTCSLDLCNEGIWAPETALRDIIEFDIATELSSSGSEPDWISLDLGSAGADFIQEDTNGIVTFMIASPYDMIQFFSKEYEGGAYAPTLELELACPGCLFGDINSDGIVNFTDLAVVAENWLEEVPGPCAELPGKKCRYKVTKLTPQNGLECPHWLLLGHKCIHGDCADKVDCDEKLRFRFRDESNGYDCMIDFDLIDCAKTAITQLCTTYWTEF